MNNEDEEINLQMVFDDMTGLRDEFFQIISNMEDYYTNRIRETQKQLWEKEQQNQFQMKIDNEKDLELWKLVSQNKSMSDQIYKYIDGFSEKEVEFKIQNPEKLVGGPEQANRQNRQREMLLAMTSQAIETEDLLQQIYDSE